MLLPKRAVVNFRVLPKATAARCFSATSARSWATPTNKYPSKDARSGEQPVEDIDLVFDYPSESQARHEKQRLEEAGLDLHSAMPHRPKGQNMPGGATAKEMGASDSRVINIGLGAVGLGGLYMVMRRRTRTDMAAQRPGQKPMESTIGRSVSDVGK
ncbi:hypothetical protein N657DRAFT_580375 [Parathielavia appendiculata]|uniref:Uncharacterized protein n=1 Tax=Parathielavia appendiculata TaxID=2587402 RepID=A0AAN6Z145_9PEZI|nr:hypothetical protein N657DRAFT_580375 [Parathielavia appendiculata]